MGEEPLGVGELVGVAVEVDEHVGAVAHGALHYGVDDGVGGHAVAVEAAVEMGHAHGAAHDVGAPVAGEAVDGAAVIEARPHIVPSHADAAQLHGLPLCVHELCSFHAQLSVLLYGSSGSGAHCSGSGECQRGYGYKYLVHKCYFIVILSKAPSALTVCSGAAAASMAVVPRCM